MTTSRSEPAGSAPTLLVDMNLSVSGTIAFDDKARRYQAVMSSNAGFKGVAVGRITASGMGEVKPIADNATEEGRAQNRRVTIRRTDCGPAN